jgi:hypothetical protein
MPSRPLRLARVLIRDSTAVRKSIVEKIISGGYMMSSCTNCRLAGRASCTVSSSPSLSKCASCTLSAVPCDIKEFNPSACTFSYSPNFPVSCLTVPLVSKIVREHDKLEEEEEEIVAHLLKIRRLKKVLRSRGIEMANRGFESLEELEADDRRREEACQAEEALAMASIEAMVPASGVFDGIDWSAVDSLSLVPVDLGASSETVV